jgi:effector-binding domain-containing protein
MVGLYMAESVRFTSWTARKVDQPCDIPAGQAATGVVKVAAGWSLAAGFNKVRLPGRLGRMERSMHCLGRSFSAAFVVAALALAGAGSAFAQAPATPPAPAAPPAATPAPAAPAAPAPDSTAPAKPADPFGEEVTMTPKTIIYLKGSATWDSAFETILDSFKNVYAFLDRQGIKPAGPAMTIYTASDDAGFEFQAAVPVAEAPKDPPHGDLAVGTSPDGKALKFVHRGSYDSLDAAYDAITHYLDERKLEAKDLYIEQYQTDLLATPEDNLVIEVLVPIK